MEGHGKSTNSNAHNKKAPKVYLVDVFRVQKEIWDT
jgi:hypothetical protein